MLKFIILSALSSAAVAQSPEDKVAAVQEFVNQNMEYKSDGVGIDSWKSSKDKGDCEEFVLFKRNMLIDQHGWEPSDLKPLMVIRFTPEQIKNNGGGVYQGHLVLYVKSLDLILNGPSNEKDSKNIPVQTFDQYMGSTGYRVNCVISDLSLRSGVKGSDRCSKDKSF